MAGGEKELNSIANGTNLFTFYNFAFY